MKNENPRIEWTEKAGKSCLKFTFTDKLLEKDAITAIEKWREAFSSRHGEDIYIIWDCLNMTGYDTEARIRWQEALKEMKDQIGSIWLITTSHLIKMGASIMRVFTSLDIEIVSSENEIDIQ